MAQTVGREFQPDLCWSQYKRAISGVFGVREGILAKRSLMEETEETAKMRPGNNLYCSALMVTQITFLFLVC